MLRTPRAIEDAVILSDFLVFGVSLHGIVADVSVNRRLKPLVAWPLAGCGHTPIGVRVWEGHDFSRAVESFKPTALQRLRAAFGISSEFFSSLVGRITLTEVHVLELALKARKVEKVGILAGFSARKR